MKHSSSLTIPRPKFSDSAPQKAESGQVFFEFILLLLVLTILSYTMLHGVNRGVAARWQAMVHLVTKVEGSSPPQFQ